MRPMMTLLGPIHQRCIGSDLPGESDQEQLSRHGRAGEEVAHWARQCAAR
jgi:hypothetical protein